jgi:hypothetical protein
MLYWRAKWIFDQSFRVESVDLFRNGKDAKFVAKKCEFFENFCF